MKKLFKCLTVIMLAMVMVFAQTGCNFVLDNKTGNLPGSVIEQNGNQDGSNENQNQLGSASYQDTGDATSSIYSKALQSVVFNRPSFRGQPLDKIEATEKVDRSVVSIETEDGLGSGVIIDITVGGQNKSNIFYILTCHHVISGKGNIKVNIPNENCEYKDQNFTFSGKVGGKIADNADCAVTLVGGDVTADLALLKLDTSKKPVSGNTFDNSKIVKATVSGETDQVKKGEEVFAIGNSAGVYDGRATYGYVAYPERETNVDGLSMLLIDINVDIYHGNSGGGLFNMYGELIGITNSGNTEFSGVNFAIPLYTSNKNVEGKIDNGIINVVTQLAGTASNDNYGFVKNRRAMFGFTVTKGTANQTEYVYILSVVESSLAQSAGLITNDIIQSIKINSGQEQTVTSYEQYIGIMNTIKLGDTMVLKISRSVQVGFRYQEQILDITLTARHYHFCNTVNL